VGIEVVSGTGEPALDRRICPVDDSLFRAMGFEPRWSMANGVTDLLTRLAVANATRPTTVGVDRHGRLEELRSSGVLNSDLRSGVLGLSASMGVGGSAPLVSPAVLDAEPLERVAVAQRQVLSTSRYRMQGAHASHVEYLLAERLNLPDDWGVLALRSGADALARALWLAGVRAGASVVIPDLAFHRVASTVLSLGARPVVLDISPTDWNLDPDLLAFALRGRDDIRAVVAVDNYGTPSNWPALGSLCQTGGVPLIVDACQSLGATRPDGAVSDAADYLVTSFNFTSAIHSAGTGGALSAPTRHIARALDTPELLVHQTRLPELNAAYLVEAWRSLDANVAHLRRIYDAYQTILEPEGFEPQEEFGVSTRVAAPFLVPVVLADHRDELLELLAGIGIEGRAQFPSQSRLLGLGQPPSVSADVDRRVISLPTGAGLKFDRMPEIAEGVLRSAASLGYAR